MTSATETPGGRPPLEFALRNRKIGGAVSGRREAPAIDDRAPRLDLTLAPVVAAEHPPRFVNGVELDAIP
jgi:hypothetical protein